MSELDRQRKEEQEELDRVYQRELEGQALINQKLDSIIEQMEEDERRHNDTKETHEYLCKRINSQGVAKTRQSIG